MKKTIAVLGLGIFGSTIAKELTKYNQEVIAIDKDMTCVERVSEFVANAICLDFTDLEQLEAAGVADADVAVVATGSHLEDSILAIMNLKQLGINNILAKAKNRRYSEVLSKVGASKVITPEKEMGIRMAKALLAKNILDVVDIDDEHVIIEIEAPKSWVDKNLIELNLRSRLGVNILGVRKKGVHRLTINPDPYAKIENEDRILMIMKKEVFKDSEALERMSV